MNQTNYENLLNKHHQILLGLSYFIDFRILKIQSLRPCDHYKQSWKQLTVKNITQHFISIQFLKFKHLVEVWK